MLPARPFYYTLSLRGAVYFSMEYKLVLFHAFPRDVMASVSAGCPPITVGLTARCIRVSFMGGPNERIVVTDHLRIGVRGKNQLAM